jgi:GDP-L-fucose synthase
MPNNLYGPNDNFDLETSHVLPALLRKFHEAKECNKNSVEIWGSGKPLREFLHVDDLADACVFLMQNLSAKQLYSFGIPHINIGSGDEISIKKLALMIKGIVGYEGEIVFNSNFPDGMPRKLLNTSRLNAMGWESNIKLENGLNSVYEWYLDKLPMS